LYNCRILIFFLLISISISSQNDKGLELLDSIYSLRSLSKDNSLETNSRIAYAKNAIELSIKTGYDSTLLKSKRNLSFLYLNYGDISDLKAITSENHALAERLKDSVAMANADYILGYAYHEELKYDSAYYHYFNAVKFYKALKDNEKSGEVLMNMANIQQTARDYIGSEFNAIASKELFEKLPKNDRNLSNLWSANNLIGIISGELKLYDKSLEYHDLAYDYTNKMKDGYYYKILTNSNIASTYRKKGDYANIL